jgi:hypothetical protein
MKKVNSVSGGGTSGYISANYPADYNVFALVCIDDPECAPKDNAIIRYTNDKLSNYTQRYGEFIATTEDDETIVAMMDLEQYIGKEIVWVRGASFDDVIDKPLIRGENPTRLPSWARRYCTDQMKLWPIFEWWFHNIGERVEMRIGFRFEEFGRLERFFNNSDPCKYRIPVSTSLRGQNQMRHESFDWRFCSFPLIRDGVTKSQINEYWKTHGWIGRSDLFVQDRRQLKFPIVSNCVGCFHKKPETLSVMSNMHPEKMRWFARQEMKGMGTWLDSRVTYESIIANAENWIPEMLKETGAACDSGGCTD